MKAALIGAGKTGGYVAEFLENPAVFDRSNPPTPESLKPYDVAIVFVPGSAAAELVEILLEAGIPAVWGTTGYEWPADLAARLETAGTRWVLGSNFSLGMNLMRRCLEVIGRGEEFLEQPDYHIHEVHHVHKQDAPSGTALKWKEWLGVEQVRITSAREGDVKGIHELYVKTPGESLWLRHEAHDRSIFARGAVWAARYLLDHPELAPGLYTFESITDLAFRK